MREKAARRQRAVLEEILRRFVEKNEPIGSKQLELGCSSATIRNDMAALEERGLIHKAHLSGGRLPTAKAFRWQIDEFLAENVLLLRPTPESAPDESPLQQRVSRAVAELAESSQMLAFATLSRRESILFGLSRFLSQPEFSDPLKISEIIDLLENRARFADFIESLELGEGLRVFIGAENSLPILAPTSLLAARWRSAGEEGALGLLGPVRMNYPRQLATLKGILEKFALVETPLELPAARGFFLG